MTAVEVGRAAGLPNWNTEPTAVGKGVAEVEGAPKRKG